MMNKLPSTRSHLVKFLLLLPLMSVLLLAFRGVNNDSPPVQGSPAKQKEPKNLVTTKPGENNNTLLAVFQDGTQEKYDLTTEAGKEGYRKAQLFFGDAYNPEDLKRGWPEEFKTFLSRNPQVAKIKWRYDMAQLRKGDFVYPADRLYITLKSGAEEVYTIESKEDLSKVENQFGKLPMLPPPPPVISPGK